uniref:Uncharacterized protein n=1 Tax=Cannabis sativa TaxID=3483 RepID=A0A803NK71_CANSA
MAYRGYYPTGLSGYATGAQLPGAALPAAPQTSRIQFSATPGYTSKFALAPALSHLGAPVPVPERGPAIALEGQVPSGGMPHPQPPGLPPRTNRTVTMISGVHFLHHDPLVIETPIANKVVARILVDNGSSVNFLFKDAFTTIGLINRDLSPSDSQLTGFNETTLVPMEKVRLLITLCLNTPKSTFKYCTFVVVDCPIAYNAILGRLALVDFRAIPAIRHLCLKFPTQEVGVGTVRGNQGEARQCYNAVVHYRS